jgi:hypothetical protein
VRRACWQASREEEENRGYKNGGNESKTEREKNRGYKSSGNENIKQNKA